MKLPSMATYGWKKERSLSDGIPSSSYQEKTSSRQLNQYGSCDCDFSFSPSHTLIKTTTGTSLKMVLVHGHSSELKVFTINNET